VFCDYQIWNLSFFLACSQHRTILISITFFSAENAQSISDWLRGQKEYHSWWRHEFFFIATTSKPALGVYPAFKKIRSFAGIFLKKVPEHRE
jgi:hypothetical protein